MYFLCVAVFYINLSSFYSVGQTEGDIIKIVDIKMDCSAVGDLFFAFSTADCPLIDMGNILMIRLHDYETVESSEIQTS